MKIGWRIAFAIGGILLGAGLLKYLVQEPVGEAVVLRAPPTPQPVQVHVSGGVLLAGVYTLPAGSRVRDAVQAAGGLSADAEPDELNLARIVQDGEHILVPVKVAVSEASNSSGDTPADRSSIQEHLELINLNTANQQELETLPGIGEVLAQAIIIFRETNGPFQSIEDILEVEGIGTVKYEQIKDLITVGDAP